MGAGGDAAKATAVIGGGEVLSPDDAAARVIEGVREDRFLIYTHPEMRAVRGPQGRGPGALDPRHEPALGPRRRAAGRGGLAPGLVGHVDDQAQLGPLLVLGERVALDGAGEAALRAEAQLLERDVPGGLLDPRRSSSRSPAPAACVVTSPSTTVLSAGTKRSGAKSPERSSSYSRK